MVDVPALLGKKAEAKPKKESDHHTISIPFGDVVVNLAEDRMQQYLQVKVALKVEDDEEGGDRPGDQVQGGLEE